VARFAISTIIDTDFAVGEKLDFVIFCSGFARKVSGGEERDGRSRNMNQRTGIDLLRGRYQNPHEEKP
jgi:hypothetical protein